MKQYQPEPLNRQASVLVDCQTDIKITIKNGVLSGAPFFVIEKQTKKLIDRALNKISSPTLKEDARVSLTRFARRAYEDLKRTFPSAKKAVAIYVLHRHGKYIGCRYGKKIPDIVENGEFGVDDQGRLKFELNGYRVGVRPTFDSIKLN